MSQLNEAHWRKIVLEGYEDIDWRCNRYLGWLVTKRGERGFTNQTLSALMATLGGLSAATGAAEAIGYTGLALGLAGSIYNNYQETLLNGLETTAIVKNVLDRRTQFRTAFEDARITSKPEAEYVLRAYLRICTPASIIMNANEALLVFSSGESVVPPHVRELQRQRDVLPSYTPPTPETRVDQRIPRAQLPRPPAVVEQVFEGPGWTIDSLRDVQAALCVLGAERDRVGPRTIANINLFSGASEKDASSGSLRRKINRDAYRTLSRSTGFACATTGPQNWFENTSLRDPKQQTQILAAMHKLSPGETGSPPTLLSDPQARPLIGRAREACGLNNRPGPLKDQITRDLEDKLAAGECRSQSQ